MVAATSTAPFVKNDDDASASLLSSRRLRCNNFEVDGCVASILKGETLRMQLIQNGMRFVYIFQIINHCREINVCKFKMKEEK